MMRSDGYLDDMTRFGTFTDHDIDDLLSGRAISDSRLGELSELVMALRAEGLVVPPQAQRHVASAADLARDSAPTTATAPAAIPLARWSMLARFRNINRRAVTAAAAVVVLLSGVNGLAFAANGSGPDDSLYGIDLALERVGIGSGGAVERLAEASELVSSGAGSQGLSHAASALSAENAQNQEAGMAASAALAEAASKVSQEGSQVPAGVGDLLRYLSEAVAGEGVNGETVAQWAQLIRDSVTHPNTPLGPAEGVPSSPPGTPVGPPASTPANDSVPPINPPQGPQGPP